ncbi:MAG: hypothetical protein ACTHNY_08965 [Solirubrobacterales bacterium]
MNVLNSGEAKAALDVLEAVLAPAGAVYVCGPLDHGVRYYEARARGESGDGVREPNQAELTAFVEKLRREQSKPVIDPGLLRVEGWDPRAYGEFFLEIIRRYVGEAWFIDGWAYSHGATKEFLLCLELNLKCFDAKGSLLSADRGAAAITRAADHIAELGANDSKLRERLNQLQAAT